MTGAGQADHGIKNSLGGACCDNDVLVRVYLYTFFIVEPFGNNFPEFIDPFVRPVVGKTVAQRLDGRLHDRSRGIKIGFPKFQMHDRLSLSFQFFGPFHHRSD